MASGCEGFIDGNVDGGQLGLREAREVQEVLRWEEALVCVGEEKGRGRRRMGEDLGDEHDGYALGFGWPGVGISVLSCLRQPSRL